MNKKPETFEDAVKLAKEILAEAGNEAALMLNEKPPSIIEYKIPEGVRLVLRWSDGEESSECIVSLNPDRN